MAIPDPAQPPPQHPPPPEPPAGPPPLSQRARMIGNLSLIFLLATIVYFWSWRWYTRLPAGTELHLAGGRLELTVGQVGAFMNVLLGFLGGVGAGATLAAVNLHRTIAEIFDPLNLIEDAKIRARLCKPPVLVFAGLSLVFTVAIASSVTTVDVESEYEVVAQLAPGSAARFLDAEGRQTDAARITRDAPARLVVAGPSALLLRDKYALRALEALYLDRKWNGFIAEPCALEGPPAGGTRSDAAGVPGLVVRARGVQIVDALRWSDDRVRTPLVLGDGAVAERGWIRAGDGHDGPERGAPDYAEPYLEQLFRQRDRFSEWYRRPAYDWQDRLTVSEAIDGYNLEFTFEERRLLCSGFRPFSTRDAIELRAVTTRQQ